MNRELRVYRASVAESIFSGMNNTNATTTWTIDPAHTTVGFAVRHLMITTVRGLFDRVSGTIQYDAAHPEATTIVAEIPADSVHTRDAQRDEHLKSADFFDVQRFPVIAFRSTRARKTAEQLEVTGELTMHGVTREVTLAVNEITGETRDHRGLTRIGASATAKVRRSEFGIVYNKVLETGGVAVADEIALSFDVSLVKSA